VLDRRKIQFYDDWFTFHNISITNEATIKEKPKNLFFFQVTAKKKTKIKIPISPKLLKR
jgi:hypothetical protein